MLISDHVISLVGTTIFNMYSKKYLSVLLLVLLHYTRKNS